MKKNQNRKRLRMAPRTTQKFQMRYVVAGSSVLALMLGVFAYVNFSNSVISKADGKGDFSKVNYRTTDINVPDRMLRTAGEVERMEESSYKSNSASLRELPSRATDVTAPVSDSN
jgi:hypothetical protein